MKEISILHLSDLHMSSERISDIKIVIEALFSDLEKLRRIEGHHIDFVCFTGDLIQRGDKANEQFELVRNRLINPLLKILDLTPNELFIIPGNHEVDRSKVDEVMEIGLKGILTDREATNRFLDQKLSNAHIERISHFNDFAATIHSEAVAEDLLMSCHIRAQGSTKIGFACLNSAWRCSGDDKENLIVGERQIDKALQTLESCDIKIALMHHPTFWLAEHDKRAVEARLSEFDIVLNGHLHDLGEKNIITGGHTTLYCSCGSLFDGRSPYNGYSIVKISPLTRRVTVHLREYFDNKRRVFDKALSIAEEGVVTYQLGRMDDNTRLSHEIVEELIPSFINYANQLLVSNMVDDTAPTELDRLFIDPVLSRSSEYIKEKSNMEKDVVHLSELINSDKNIMFVGKKETGKTTILHYIGVQSLRYFSNKFKLPFVIDVRTLPKGLNQIEKLMCSFVSNTTDYKLTPTMEQVSSLLQDGRCLLLVDNLNSFDQKSLDVLRAFIKKYPDNRYIFSLDEDVFHVIKEDDLPVLDCEYEAYYIHTLSRGKIRSLTQNWFGDKEIDINQFLDRTMFYLQNVGMPRTPFVVSLILAICHQQEDYIPVNEASVMEQFMEMLLEKLSVEETKTSTYDFKIKENFLMSLAWEMVERNQYQISKKEFIVFSEKYFNEKGLDFESSKFKTLFFEKKIFVEQEGTVYFRYRSILEYYIAKKALHDEEAVKFLVKESNLVNFSNEINFLTGMARDRQDILFILETVLIQRIEGAVDSIKHLHDYDLKIDIPLDEVEVRAKIESLKLDEQARDSLLDIPDENHSFDKQKVEKGQSADNHYDTFGIFLLYGRVLRNSELLFKQDKLRGLQLFILCNCVFWASIKKDIEDTITRENLDKWFADEKDKHLSEEVDLLREVFKVGIPIALQNIAAEAVGTVKLHQIIEELINRESNEFMKFMLVFLYADLKLHNYLAILERFIRRADSRDILQLSYYKLMYYYRTGHVSGKNVSRIESILGEIVATYHGLPRHSKGAIIADLKKPLALSDFLK